MAAFALLAIVANALTLILGLHQSGDFGVTNNCEQTVQVQFGDGESWTDLVPGDTIGPLFSGTEVRYRTSANDEPKVANNFLGLRTYGPVELSGNDCSAT